MDRSASFFFTHGLHATFYETCFSRVHGVIHSDNKMKRFDAAAEKQLVFNFLGVSRSLVLDFDKKKVAHNISTTNFREFLRYLMEDMI